MITFERDQQQTIPDSQVKIIGLGGAGSNMLDRVALDGMEGAELLAINTDVRLLQSSVANEKIQIGRNLTRGLGCGGDPELGQQAVHEAETEVRDALKNRKIVFLCVGLGGGTGSGAASVITRIAREEGAFVVIFATMPFSFEGNRRRDQARTALNELAALSNALVTFDNGRMGELVLAKQGIHEAFAAADRMISDSIRAVTRLVIRPGLINVGLDDLMTALRTTRSRCLFGSGIGNGQSRSQQALKKALSSPLLDRGSLLEDAETVLVHVCGGDDLTLYEVELLMRGLSKNVPDNAHVLFGAAIDPSMGDSLSVTIISSLPEEKLQMTSRAAREEEPEQAVEDLKIQSHDDDDDEEEEDSGILSFTKASATTVTVAETEEVVFEIADEQESEPEDEAEVEAEAEAEAEVEVEVEVEADEGPVAEEEAEPEEPEDPDEMDEIESLLPTTGFSAEDIVNDIAAEEEAEKEAAERAAKEEQERMERAMEAKKSSPRSTRARIPEPREKKAGNVEKKIEPKPEPRRKQQTQSAQSELEFGGGPKGKFEDAPSNSVNGEDLNIPTYLRRKKDS